ncbi:domain-containing protein [Babesia ovata]|uniref:Domain-containing protein n=1 Tax=Babesia ovata TaxID=189622 RepID=A0A2H6K9X7_9APIC|nr:domain-containing protein [Babesia ovata]GBE59790.1 domain-containing protein [Babesia ovata]
MRVFRLVCGGAVRRFSIYNHGLQREVKAGRLTHYDVLQLPKDASAQQVKEAYLRLVKLHHPDASKHPDSPSIFICIKEAHETLADPAKRRVYDADIAKTTGEGSARASMRRQPGVRGTGYEYSESQARDQERWERYSRYVRGERNDAGERYVVAKTMMALGVSAATVLGLSVFAEEFFSHFKGIGEEEDDVHVDSTNERRVPAYFNPATERWERIVPPFVPPAPAELLRHYRDLDDDDFDETQVAAALPKRNFVVMERCPKCNAARRSHFHALASRSRLVSPSPSLYEAVDC